MTTPQYGVPVSYDWAIRRGDAVGFGFVASDADGNYLQFAGLTARAQVRADPEDATVVLELTCAIVADPDGRVGPDLAVAKRVDITALGSVTALIGDDVPRICYWDVELGTAPDYDDAVTYLQGEVQVNPDVTR